MSATKVGADLLQRARVLLRTPRGANTRVILGSSSQIRRKLMDKLCEEVGENLLRYDVLTADIDEKAIRRKDPSELVTVLAKAKAEAIKKKMKLLQEPGQEGEALLITCDQVVVHEGRILEKPETAEEAREFIAGYARNPCSTVGAVAVTDLGTGRVELEVDEAHIHFTPIPVDTVDALVEEGEVFWCAGGLMVEHEMVQPHVTKIEGTMDGVMGLPKARVLGLLSKFY